MTASSKMWRAFSLILTGMQMIFFVVDIPAILPCNWHCNTANWLESGWSFNTAAYFCILTGLTSLKFLKGAGGVSASHSGLLARKLLCGAHSNKSKFLLQEWQRNSGFRWGRAASRTGEQTFHLLVLIISGPDRLNSYLILSHKTLCLF